MLPTLSSVSTTLNSNLLTSGPTQIKSEVFDITRLGAAYSNKELNFRKMHNFRKNCNCIFFFFESEWEEQQNVRLLSLYHKNMI